ncbi:MAG: diaminopimelate epimerase [Caulobacteraceae bacterium]
MINFVKYHGLGNDFIIIDNTQGSIAMTPEKVQKMCHRYFGIGGDGVILAEKSKQADVKMVIINSDGSRAEMCGNGLRCLSKFAYEKLGIRKNPLLVETGAGNLTVQLKMSNNVVDTIKVNMGKPIFDFEKIPCTIEKEPIANHPVKIGGKEFRLTAMYLGVPHTVVFADDIDDESVISNGRIIENSEFFPRKANVNFVKIIKGNEIAVRTWERGAGYTYACGTGSCASVVAGILNGMLDKEVLVHLRGGDLLISWQQGEDVYMEGPSVEVYEGCYKMD